MKKRQWIVSGVITLLIILLGAMIFQRFKGQKQSTISEEPATAELRTVQAKRFPLDNIRNTISVDGRATAYEQINLGAEVSGKLLKGETQLKAGSTFEKGTVLFRIDGQDDVYSLYAQRSALLTAITQIMPDLKFDYPAAFDKWKNYLDAFNVEKNVSALPDINNQNEKYYIAGKNILSLYYSIKALETKLANYTIIAPFSGVFLSVDAYPGSLVSPGAQLGRIMNTAKYELVATIAVDQLKYVKNGQKVRLSSVDSDKSWNGTVVRFSRQIDPSTQSIPVYINVRGSGLRDGMYLMGSINGSTLSNVSQLPRTALIGEEQVYIIQDDKVEVKQIDVKSRTDNSIIVSGLEGDEFIIYKNNKNLYVGQSVQINNED